MKSRDVGRMGVAAMTMTTDESSGTFSQIAKRCREKVCFKRGLAVLLAVSYTLPYVLLSIAGEYSPCLYSSTTLVYRQTGLSVPDSTIWMPCLIKWTPYEKNWLGWGYAPLVKLDRLFWHKNILVICLSSSSSATSRYSVSHEQFDYGFGSL